MSQNCTSKEHALLLVDRQQGPTFKLFARFKEEFNNIVTFLEDFVHWKWPDYSNSFLAQQATEVKTWAIQCLEKKVFSRKDYLLIAFFLGAKLPAGFTIRRSGADHIMLVLGQKLYII